MRRKDYTGRALIVYWLPAAAWAALVLAASGDLFSSEHTSGWLGEIIARLVGHPLPARLFDLIHFLIRKTAHLTEYAILGALTFRAVRGDDRGWRPRWAWLAATLAALVAIADEWHQFFVPMRTSSAWDVLLDVAGAALAQWFCRRSATLDGS